MTLMNDSATPVIIIGRMYSRAAVSTGCWAGGEFLIPKLQQDTELILSNQYHFCTLPAIVRKLFWAIITHLSTLTHRFSMVATDNNRHSRQYSYRCSWHTSECPVKTNFICHQYSWYIGIPNQVPHHEPWCPNLQCQKCGTRQFWDCIPVERNVVIFQFPRHLLIQKHKVLSRHVCAQNLWTEFSTVLYMQLQVSRSSISSPSCTCLLHSLVSWSIFFSSSISYFGYFGVWQSVVVSLQCFRRSAWC
jgi:hypothetical protein